MSTSLAANSSLPVAQNIVGTMPVLPYPFTGWTWLIEPIRAERLAAFRIGLGLCLMLDILFCYLIPARQFFGVGSLGSPQVFAGRMNATNWRWSLLAGEGDFYSIQVILLVWFVAALLMTLGIAPRFHAFVAWGIGLSLHNLNYYIHNSGDNVRFIGLFYLMLAPCGAVWSLANWLPRPWGKSLSPAAKDSSQKSALPVYISAWPVRLLLIQLAVIYFVNGLYKYQGEHWRAGDVMHYVLGNLAWTRVAYDWLPLPAIAIPAMTYLVLYWELAFPLLMCIPRLRAPTLWLGVMFHLGTGLMLQIGLFPLYMLCLYLPLIPWERYALTKPGSRLPS